VDSGGMDGGETDGELMLRIAGGSDAAMRTLMLRHMRRTIRLAESIVRMAAEADDIAQEAFMRVWQNAPRFDPAQARFPAWLGRIAVNLAIDRLRRPQGEPIGDHPDIPANETPALEKILAGERVRSLQQAMSRLSGRQRAAIALFHFEGLSGRDCAEAMGLSSSAFESLLQRARSALKDMLGGEDAPGDGT
jgi:RNA polymerase sigma-70 factor, ECF subfamily